MLIEKVERVKEKLKFRKKNYLKKFCFLAASKFYYILRNQLSKKNRESGAQNPMPIPILQKLPDSTRCRFRLIGPSLVSMQNAFGNTAPDNVPVKQ